MIRIASTVNDSIVDGPGLRFTVFTQGCPHRCVGCHNPDTHDPLEGHLVSCEEIMEKINKNPLLDGVTLSGGEPMDQAENLAPLALECKKAGLNVWVYTGYLFEDLVDNPACMSLLKNTDVLVDGPFILARRSLELFFCGSDNQRVIDVAKSLETGNTVLWHSTPRTLTI